MQSEQLLEPEPPLTAQLVRRGLLSSAWQSALSRGILLTISIAVISLSPEILAQSRMTAKHLKAVADSLSVVIASSAELARVKSFDVDTTEESSVRTYTYFSCDTSNTRNSEEYSFIAQDGQVAFCDSGAVPWGAFVILREWIDSDSELDDAAQEGDKRHREGIEKVNPSVTAFCA